MACALKTMICHPAISVFAWALCVCIEATVHGNTSHAVKPHLAALQTKQLAAIQQPSQPRHIPTLYPYGNQYPKENLPKYFLSKATLGNIHTISCLEQQQRFPGQPCTDEKMKHGPFNIGRYPDWKDPTCRSNAEFFCDPDKLVNDGQELHYVQNTLQNFRETTMVDCRQFKAVMDPDIERTWYQRKSPFHQDRMGMQDYRHFNFGIILADQWPDSEMDPQSMQYFGRVVMSEWGLVPIYNGVDAQNSVNQNEMQSEDDYRANCPNAAMLILLPRYHEAFLSAPSCEFICQSRGGPEVIAEALAGLERGGVPEAIDAAVKEVSRVLKETIPLSLKKVPVKILNRDSVSLTDHLGKSDSTWIWCLRFLYALILGIAVFSTWAFVYYVLLPQKIEDRRASSSNYREVREAMIAAVTEQMRQQAIAKAEAEKHRKQPIAIY